VGFQGGTAYKCAAEGGKDLDKKRNSFSKLANSRKKSRLNSKCGVDPGKGKKTRNASKFGEWLRRAAGKQRGKNGEGSAEGLCGS